MLVLLGGGVILGLLCFVVVCNDSNCITITPTTATPTTVPNSAAHVRVVVVGDDVSLTSTGAVGRRGIAGTVHLIFARVFLLKLLQFSTILLFHRLICILFLFSRFLFYK